MRRRPLRRLAAELLAAVLDEVATFVLRKLDRWADRLRNPEGLAESPYVTAATRSFVVGLDQDGGLVVAHDPSDPTGSYRRTPARQEPPPENIAQPTEAVAFSSPCPVDGCAGLLNHVGDHLDDAGELIAFEVAINLPTFMADRAEAVRCQSVGGVLDDVASLQCDQAAGHSGRHTALGHSWGLNLQPAEIAAGHPAVAVHERLAALLEPVDPDDVLPSMAEVFAVPVDRLPLPSEVGHGRPVVIEGPEDDHGRPSAPAGSFADDPSTSADNIAMVLRHDNTGLECPVCFRRRHTADQAAECAGIAEAIESGALQ